MKKLKDRIAYALAKREKTQAELARATKMTEAAVSLWLSGGVESMRSKTLVAVATFFNCSMEWLASGSGASGMDEEFDEHGAEGPRPGVGLNALSGDEIELVGYFRQSSMEQKNGILGAAYGIFYRKKPGHGEAVKPKVGDKDIEGPFTRH